tara:strand:+ start:33 stop:221 length:189 start_codon:yes stop_codon:yes gene_type:complete
MKGNTMSKKWKVWFLTHGDPKWYTSGVEWDNETEAIQHARDKFRAWTQAQSWCVMAQWENPN